MIRSTARLNVWGWVMTGSRIFAVPSAVVLLLFAACGRRDEVAVYTALDQTYSEPIFGEFEEATGTRVLAVYDTEASKTVGLVNRILAEMDRPQCDVFWNNEIIRTLVLKRRGALQPYLSPEREHFPEEYRDPEGYWTGFAARARVIIVNTDLVDSGTDGDGPARPARLRDLGDPRWRGRIGLANPLFGTTGTHLAALFTVWGATETRAYFRALVNDNGAQVLPGNAQVKNAVAAGKLAAGLTDSDDANLALLEGKPVDIIFPDADGMGTLLIPNSVALVARCPHPAAGRKMIDFLLARATEETLCRSRSAQIPLRTDVTIRPGLPHLDGARWMKVDFEKVAGELETSTDFAHQLAGYGSPNR